MTKLLKIKIHPLLLPLFLYYVFQKNVFLFLGMIFFVTIHEMGHCITAICFGAKIKQIWFTPVGERAVIKGLEGISFLKRQIVFCSGPLVSLSIAIICMIQGSYIFTVFNIMLAVFNLLPFLPLDGGNIILHIAGKKYGILRTASILVKVSKGFGYFLIVIGILQAILYPFNISLVVIGCYIVYSNQKEYLQITYQTYQALLAENAVIKQVEQVYTKRDVKLGELVSRMHFDKYFFYCSVSQGKVEWKSQKEIMELLLKRGAEGSVWQ